MANSFLSNFNIGFGLIFLEAISFKLSSLAKIRLKVINHIFAFRIPCIAAFLNRLLWHSFRFIMMCTSLQWFARSVLFAPLKLGLHQRLCGIIIKQNVKITFYLHDMFIKYVLDANGFIKELIEHLAMIIVNAHVV